MSADTSLWTRALRSTLGHYAIAVAITVIALLVRWLLDPLFGDFTPYTTLYPGVAFLALYVGLGPSIVSVILGLVGAVYWFVPPRGSFEIVGSANVAGAWTFLMVCAFLVVAGEISRRSQIRFQRTEKLFETFLDSSPDAEFLKDEKGTYVYVNKTLTRHFGEGFIGKTDSEMFPGPYAEQWRSNDLKVLKDNRAHEFIETAPGGTDEDTWLSVKFPLVDGEGRKLLGGKSRDITEQKRAEAEIARLQQENARRVAAELEAMMRLLEVGNRCLRSEDDFHGALEAIVGAAIFLTGADKGSLQLLDPSAETLLLVAQRGFQEPFLKFFAVVKDQPCVSSVVMRGRERVVVEDVTESEILAGTAALQVLLDAGVRALQSTPLVSSTGKLLGMISTHFGQPHRPGERELHLMDLLARQAADYLERKRAEEALRISEERLRLAQMSGNVGVWDWDVKGNQLRWTPELESLYGLAPGTVQTYEDFRKRVHPDDLAMTESKRDEALHRHEPFDLEFRIIHASGKTRWVAGKGRGFYDDTGQLVRVLGNNIDITEHKQAEEEVRAASELLRRYLDAVPTGLTHCSRNLRYLMVNRAYAELAGMPVEKIVGRPIVDVMGMEAWEKIRPYVQRVLRGERVEYEMPLVYAAGGPAHVHVIYTPDRDSAGEVVGWVASVTDITENKRVEAQLRKAEKLATAGQLAASLAHEINNPLSSVTNALYLLQSRSDLDAAASSLTDLAAGELARVSRIVKQSLSYYRPGTVPQKLDLGAIVEESLQIFGEKFQRSGIQVTKRLASETSIHGFPDEIRQVIDNLLLNALEAMPKGGRLAVCVHWSRNWKSHKEGVRLTIADTGPGIPKEQMARVFEPFFTTKPEKGTGLGLWVVSGIVAKHEGSIRVRSAEIKGKSGTVVSILWPSGRELQVKPKLVRSESAA